MSNIAPIQETEYGVAAVPTNRLHLVWEECIPHLNEVVKVSHGDITLSSIRNHLVNGKSQLLCVSDGHDIVAATTIEVRTMDSGKRVLSCPIIGGRDVDMWGDMFLTTLKQLAKEYLCDEIRGCGRRGWARKWKDQGVQDIMTVYKLEL